MSYNPYEPCIHVLTELIPAEIDLANPFGREVLVKARSCYRIIDTQSPCPNRHPFMHTISLTP